MRNEIDQKNEWHTPKMYSAVVKREKKIEKEKLK